MTARDLSLFESGARLQMTESIELTLQSLRAYGPQHDHWVIAWSGGKDSTATLTVVLHLIAAGLLAGPKRLTVLYADTRQELPPLALAAEEIMDELEERGVEYRVVRAPLDKRFLVYILGRGVPPPNNNSKRRPAPALRTHQPRRARPHPRTHRRGHLARRLERR